MYEILITAVTETQFTQPDLKISTTNAKKVTAIIFSIYLTKSHEKDIDPNN